MAWIESHQELARHPKTKRLARKLGVSLPTAVGHLHFLWWWAMDYAKDGDLSKYEPEDIADAMEWEGDPEQLVTALIESGFVDETDEGLQIHDWYDYAGRLIEKRAEDAERKRRARRKAKDVQKDVQGTSSGHPEDGARNLTIPNQNNSRGGEDIHARAGKLLKVFEESFLLSPNSVQVERLGTYLDDGMEPELIEKAILITRENGKDLNYLWGILNRLYQRGILTVAAFEHHEAERRKRREELNGTHITNPRGDPGTGPEDEATGYYSSIPGLIKSI